MTAGSISLPKDWCSYTVNPGVDTDLPGIYEWNIEEAGSYIGKYGRVRRPTREYRRNVVRLLNKKPYRKGKPDGYRRIHLELERAWRDGRRIELIIVENVSAEGIRQRERELIAIRGTLND
jgi:hypothetical protein